jgi:hypothetical protein
MPGSMVHLTLIDNLLHHDLLTRSFWAYGALCAGAALFLALLRADLPVFLGGGAVLTIAAFAAAVLAFRRNIVIAWFGAAIPLLVGCAWAAVLRFRLRRLHG